MCLFEKFYYWRLRRQKERDDRNSQLAFAYMEGMKKGLEEELQKGRAEEKLEIARRMKENNIPVESIIELTDLDRETVEKL